MGNFLHNDIFGISGVKLSGAELSFYGEFWNVPISEFWPRSATKNYCLHNFAGAPSYLMPFTFAHLRIRTQYGLIAPWLLKLLLTKQI